MITRRDLMLSGVASAALSGCALFSSLGSRDGRLKEIRAGGRDLTLTAQVRSVAIGSKPSPLWLYGDEPFPVLRMTRGERLSVTLRNQLSEHTSIHWHGVRGPNAMDGVPYLTQLPVQPGEEFVYRFAPPDAGTFFFHPHCNTAEQMGRGLLGALIVDDEAAFDDDIVLILKDWRLGEDGQFLPFVTLGGASRAGTFGTLRTINGVASPRIAARSRTNIRLRLINADPTRICEIGIEGADAAIIAIDGNPVVPFAPKSWRFGPGMRLDLTMDMHDAGEVHLVDYFAASPIVLATLDGDGSVGSARDSSLTVSPAVDFSRVSVRTFELGAGVDANTVPAPRSIILPDGRRIDLADSLCLASGTFWTLDGKAWPDRDHKSLPPPLFSFQRGERVVLELVNTTSHAHPIHIHGHTMTVLSMSILKRPVHRADTVLVLPNERVTVGFVADNPGNWMIHCHIIEHQETGMMGWFHVA